jgi:hypothetical protein
MSVDGVWDCVTSAMFREQTSVLTIVSAGDTFSGSNVADIGSVDVIDGRIDGNRITWKMPTEKPMPMTLVGKAIVDGDTMVGTIVMGAFGNAKMVGKRRV